MIPEPFGFALARRKAKRVVRRKRRLNRLLFLAGAKAVTTKDGLKDTWNDMVTFVRLVTAWMAGTYTKIPYQSIILMVAALIYFVNPLDLIPDFLVLWGLVDDAVVLSFVAKSVHKDLEEFRAWEEIEEKGYARAEAAIVDPEKNEAKRAETQSTGSTSKTKESKT